MTDVVNEALSVAETIDPNAPAIEIASAAINTAEAPTTANIVADVELAISLVKKLQDSLAGTHPTVMKVVKAIIKDMF